MPNMAMLAFFGGVNEIGGNKILLDDQDTTDLIDFGMSFAKKELLYAEFLAPRVANHLGDSLEMGQGAEQGSPGRSTPYQCNIPSARGGRNAASHQNPRGLRHRTGTKRSGHLRA